MSIESIIAAAAKNPRLYKSNMVMIAAQISHITGDKKQGDAFLNAFLEKANLLDTNIKEVKQVTPGGLSELDTSVYLYEQGGKPDCPNCNNSSVPTLVNVRFDQREVPKQKIIASEDVPYDLAFFIEALAHDFTDSQVIAHVRDSGFRIEHKSLSALNREQLFAEIRKQNKKAFKAK